MRGLRDWLMLPLKDVLKDLAKALILKSVPFNL